jgi:phosphohistidine phosphatase
MAQQLWLLRHGEAEPHDAAPDFDRSLTERGEAQSRAAGRALANLEVTFQLVLTSPKVRARQTAELACEAFGCEVTVYEPLAGDFDGRDALEAVAMAGEEGRVLVVGHNPDFEQVPYDLTGARAEMKKGGLAGIRVRGNQGELIALLRPREIERISAAS